MYSGRFVGARSLLFKIGGLSMAWVAVDKNGDEYVYSHEPYRVCEYGYVFWMSEMELIELPKGSIKKLIGRELNWSDEPVELE